MSVDQEFADGGIVLGDTPGAGVSIDESAIEKRTVAAADWLVNDGPHVRPKRAGLQLVADPPALRN